jgi:hypothetical protein
VPGEDPNGSPGTPIAGRQAFLWGRVRNTGDEAAGGARVNFYWADPSVGVLRSRASFIGFGFVDLAPGEQKDVLSLTPWLPTIVNNGHECLVAEVIHPGDPLPLPLPDAFMPTEFHQVAQRNITVVAMGQQMLSLPVQVAAPKRAPRKADICIEIGGKLSPAMLQQLGLEKYEAIDEPVLEAGLVRQPGCPRPKSAIGETRIAVALEPGEAAAVYLILAAAKIARGKYQLVHVLDRSGENLHGGVTFVAVGE